MRLPYLPEPEPVVAEKYHDGIVQVPPRLHPLQELREVVVHGRGTVHLLVAEGVHPEEPETRRRVSYGVHEIPDQVLHPDARLLRACAVGFEAQILRGQVVGRQEVRTEVVVGRGVDEARFDPVERG